MQSDRVVKVNRFPTGELESEFTEVDGKIEGKRRRWHQSGQLFSEAEFVNGLLEGDLREWTKEGVMVLSAQMHKGEFHGRYESWWDNGTPKERGEFIDGVRQPGFTWFREDGSVWKQL